MSQRDYRVKETTVEELLEKSMITTATILVHNSELLGDSQRNSTSIRDTVSRFFQLMEPSLTTPETASSLELITTVFSSNQECASVAKTSYSIFSISSNGLVSIASTRFLQFSQGSPNRALIFATASSTFPSAKTKATSAFAPGA